MVKITPEERKHLKVGPKAIERLIRERRALIYALLCLYKGGSRQGWETGLNLTESMDLACDTLANIGFDPCTQEAAAYVEWYAIKKVEKVVSIPSEPDQIKYERDTLIWMLIDITGEPKADLFAEAIAEIKKLKEIREGATHWAGNAVHFQQEANELREQLAGKERLIESQREIIRKLRSEEWAARKLLEEIASPEPCRLDHHGYCQEHLWVGKGECAHGRARRLLGYDA